MRTQDSAPPILFQRPKLTMPIVEAAVELNVSRSKLEQLIKAGLIRCLTLQPGGERRVSYAELVRYVEAREAAGVERLKPSGG